MFLHFEWKAEKLQSPLIHCQKTFFSSFSFSSDPQDCCRFFTGPPKNQHSGRRTKVINLCQRSKGKAVGQGKKEDDDERLLGFSFSASPQLPSSYVVSPRRKWVRIGPDNMKKKYSTADQIRGPFLGSFSWLPGSERSIIVFRRLLKSSSIFVCNQ